MEISKRYRPISYLKSNTADIAKELAESGMIVITQNGIPSFVCISFEDYYEMQETNALGKLVSMGEREFEQGCFLSLEDARAELDGKYWGNNRSRRRPTARPWPSR